MLVNTAVLSMLLAPNMQLIYNKMAKVRCEEKEKWNDKWEGLRNKSERKENMEPNFCSVGVRKTKQVFFLVLNPILFYPAFPMWNTRISKQAQWLLCPGSSGAFHVSSLWRFMFVWALVISLGAAVYLGSSDTVGFSLMESSRLSSSTLHCMCNLSVPVWSAHIQSTTHAEVQERPMC